MIEICRVGVLTVSDRAFQGVYEDQSGPAIEELLQKIISGPLQVLLQIVPDEMALIEAALIDMADNEGCQLILTTGGTGPAPRDVTPDATEKIADKVLDGFGERMRAISLKYVPTAILSRQIGAIRGKALIINLPGQPKAINETLVELFEAIPYCIELVSGLAIETNEQIVKAYRPKSASAQSN